MTDREKLIELIQHEVVPYFAERIADHLISNGVTFQQWIPVTERLPEDGRPVLVFCENTTIQGGATRHIGSLDSGKFWFLKTQPELASFPFHDWKVTHWMPLPEPPHEDTK